ncbi:hypothetical protein CBOM_05803 [Ceraceosorus bombacis]|uniref:RlpA-like double-psi beta-barrel domain n=1 Tax=Ceraceosorus bombacis TaxID=401625 RepID=A0A0P1BSE4_9BASI|nr:hypothetical protein CBOM_05803 [Ceraceosorus bombacis]
MQLRLTFVAVVAAFALASLSQAEEAKPEATDLVSAVKNEVDEFGNVFSIINDGADEDGDEEDEAEKTYVEKKVHNKQSETAEEQNAQPESRSPKKHHKKNHHRAGKRKGKKHYTTAAPDTGAKRLSSSVQITWYSKNDLKNPACGNGSWNPTPSSHIGAVMATWHSSGGPKCGEFVQLCNKNSGNKCLKVRVVDYCAGCPTDAIDLTKSAFKKLSPSGGLDEGRIHGLQMYYSGKPNPFNTDLFGPFRLHK